jgi:ketosteroid isomerase-like protein
MRASFIDAGSPMPIGFAMAALLAASAPEPPPAPVVAAEYAFAADAQRFGVRIAFLAHFDAESWLFRPQPVPALAALARDPDDGSPLEWTPEIAGLSASGDMGFTSGPWTAHAPGVATGAHGHYLTVWKRGADGIWRVQVDGGIGHPPLERPTGEVKTVAFASGASTPLAADDLARRRSALEKADDDLRATRGKPQGDGAGAWRRFAASDWHVLRKGHPLAEGAEATALAAQDPAELGSGPRRSLDLASSGDLAYTIGGDATCKACGSYYRIWGWQDGGWRIVVDLEKP